jgi:hypothetical protein
MEKKRVFTAIAVFFTATAALAAQTAGVNSSPSRPTLSFSTNLAYFAFSAFNSGGDNLFLLLPLEAEIGIGASFSIRPEAGLMLNRESGAPSASSTLIVNCGAAWYPQRNRPRGWYLAAAPGIGASFAAGQWLFLLSAEGGYQWLLGRGLLLGLGGGCRWVAMMDGSGSMPLPDLRLRVGWAF